MAIGALMLDLEGVTLTEAEITLIRHPQVGGVILFARNYKSPEQIQALIRDIRRLREEIIIAVDQEGGRVQRFREGFRRLPPMKVFGDLYDRDPQAALSAVRQCGWLMATEVLSVGVDISFAPVLDIDFGLSQVIGDRAFHAEPEKAIPLQRAFIQGMQAAGMAATGKHFPGHGSVAADSHIAIPVDDRPWAAIEALDLKPFVALANEIQGVMPAHVIYPQVDAHPAGFSAHWLQKILREQLGFKGVIFSDDLAMEGAVVAGTFADRAKAALDAGCDMVLVCNHRQGALEVLSYLETRRQLPDQARFEALRGRFPCAWGQQYDLPGWEEADQAVSAMLTC